MYALGVVLWEVLTGRRAEEAPDPSLPDASALNPDVTLLLGQVVARAMAPAPEDRYQSADEVVAALAAFIPPEADPRRDLADLLGLCFNVALQKQLLADDIAEAKQFLRGPHVVTLPLPSLADLPAPPAEETLLELQPAPRAEETVPTPATANAAKATVPTPLTTNAAKATVPTAATANAAKATVPIAALATDKRRDSSGPWLAAAVATLVVTSGIGLLRTHGRTARSRASAAALVVAPPPAAPVVPELSVSAAANPAVVAADVPSTDDQRPLAVRAPDSPHSTARTPRNAPAEKLLRQANDLWERGNTPRAYVLARQAVAAGAGAPAHVLLGALLINMKNYAAAEPELATAARLDPRNAEARKMLASSIGPRPSIRENNHDVVLRSSLV